MKSSKRRQKMLQGFIQIEFAETDPTWGPLPQMGICETRDGKFCDGEAAHMADGFHFFEMIDGCGRARNDKFRGPFSTEQAAAQGALEIIQNQQAFLALIRKGRIVKTKQIRDGQPVYVAREFATPEEIAEQEQEQQQESYWAARTTAPALSRAH